ncbi:dihydrolipoamide acetyltransferase family protein [Balneolales bacterium ANBcel1]|nr:dihydrolipoamide acetyltransferase family protein [Balneolales bacterium ANBcel1]
MARVEVTMPKMGESIMEGTVVEWSKSIGDYVEQDETLLEIATDKVDSEVPAPEAGVLVEILVDEGETVEVGAPIAVLETDPDAAEGVASGESSTGDESAEEASGPGEADSTAKPPKDSTSGGNGKGGADAASSAKEDDSQVGSGSANGVDATDAPDRDEQQGAGSDSQQEPVPVAKGDTPPQRKGSDGRFFSPLVRAIAKEEGISQEELESLEGSGNQGRVTKQDVLDYVQSGRAAQPSGDLHKATGKQGTAAVDAGEISPVWPKENVEIIKMDRMRKVISEHMIRSKQTSAHVTTFAEADVTRLVQYREKHKDRFLREQGFKLTFTPFFIEATIRALREFPMLNSSVDGDRILLKKNINYGLAVALGEAGKGGLIVPVIKNAGEMNLLGLARSTHDLAVKAREKKLLPDDLAGGTFTFTNYGSVGNLMGTPIINQPQVAIFGTGMIQKRPVVIEVDGTDTIAIRHMVYLSMSYDHRIIDGAMGGAFVQRVKQLLETFDVNRTL